MSQDETVINPKIQEKPQFGAEAKSIKIFSQANMQKIQELHAANDELHRQIAQMEKDVSQSSDALTLLAEKERCAMLIARNAGEIAKIHAENEERIHRISELEGKNIRLAAEKVSERDGFSLNRDPYERAKHAANFFLTQSRLQKNADEIFELNQE